MSNNVEFKAWPKMTRENPFSVTITEKMDGTNACIIIQDGELIGVQSRKKLITPENDNYGFAGWVSRNTEELLNLGDGYHYGEWAGLGIQGNPHNLPEKQFFLFNTHKWALDRPNCCQVVATLFRGLMDIDTIPTFLKALEEGAPEGVKPEGITVFHHALSSYTKHTIKSPNGKWCK